MGVVTGGLNTRSTGVTNVIEYNVDRKILQLVTKEAVPLLTYITGKNARIIPTDSSEWHTYDIDNYTYRHLDVTTSLTAVATASTITTGLAQATPLYAGALIKVPRTGETLLVKTVTDSRTFQAVRSYGTTAVGEIKTTDVLFVIGNVNQEGGGLLTVIQGVPTRRDWYAQIFKTPFAFTGTYEATKMYTGDAAQQEVANQLIKHMLDIEAQFLFGEGQVDTSTFTNVARSTYGVVEKITTNATNVGGALDEDAWEEFLRTGMRYSSTPGKKHKLFLCSSLIGKYINSFAREKLQTVNDATSYGVAINRYRSNSGTVDIKVHDMFEEDYEGLGLLLDVPLLAYRPLKGNGKNRDTHLRENVGTPGTDGSTHEYLTEAGLQIKGDVQHAKMTGVT